MKKLQLHFTLLFLFTYLLVNAQHIKDETIEYSYIKLPSAPLDHSIKNYQATITATYESDNDLKKVAYESKVKQAKEDYEKEKAAYPAKVKEAEDNYKNELDAWNKKSVGKKIVEREVLGENNKPVKQVPPPPVMAYVEKPDLKSSYDYTTLASTYLHLEGFENNADNAVKILVTFYGFDNTQPHQLSVQKDMTHYANGKSQSYKQEYYHIEFAYRHPMAVKVLSPEGKELFNLTPQELNTYTTYKSAETETPQPVDQQLLIKTFEEKTLQNNLKFINNLINDKIGYVPTMRKAVLYYIKDKDETYKDLLIAFNDASFGLKTLVTDPTTAKPKLQNALQVWNTALQESDVKNNKARIDKDVTISICFNMLEVYFALGNLSGADKTFATLNAIDISRSERRRKEEFETLFIDFKKRVSTNN